MTVTWDGRKRPATNSCSPSQGAGQGHSGAGLPGSQQPYMEERGALAGCSTDVRVAPREARKRGIRQLADSPSYWQSSVRLKPARRESFQMQVERTAEQEVARPLERHRRTVTGRTIEELRLVQRIHGQGISYREASDSASEGGSLMRVSARGVLRSGPTRARRGGGWASSRP